MRVCQVDPRIKEQIAAFLRRSDQRQSEELQVRTLECPQGPLESTLD